MTATDWASRTFWSSPLAFGSGWLGSKVAPPEPPEAAAEAGVDGADEALGLPLADVAHPPRTTARLARSANPVLRCELNRATAVLSSPI
jgi:hypothetical protein